MQRSFRSDWKQFHKRTCVIAYSEVTLNENIVSKYMERKQSKNIKNNIEITSSQYNDIGTRNGSDCGFLRQLIAAFLKI